MPRPPSGNDPLLHPIVREAAEGILPAWTVARPKRRAHMTRVAELMESWARSRGETPMDLQRWVAAGFLHDSLRDEDPEALRPGVEEEFRDLPGKVLHGPGAARRLDEEGVTDESLLHAIRFHTLGSQGFDSLGLALFAADFLEPGRRMRQDWRAELRIKAPSALEAVVKEILSDRIAYLLDNGRPVHPVTLKFWNGLSEGEPWASASEY